MTAATMDTKSVVIDPDGDTVIILPFIQVTKESDDATGNATDDETDDESLDYDQQTAEIPNSLLQETSQNETPGNVTVSEGVYYFKVSMKHLSLASPRAKAVLQGPYKESVPEADGFRHWNFEPIFDPEAFKIVMNIIHAQFHNIPDEVSLEMLSNIAAVVDDLNCQNSVNFLAKSWFDKLDKVGGIPWFRINMIRMIFAASVFGLEKKFKEATYYAIMLSPDIISHGLPIAPQILERIKQRRLALLQNAVEDLQNLIKEVANDLGECFLCRSAALGALITNIQTKKLSPDDLLVQSNNMAIMIFHKIVRSFTYPKVAACGIKRKPHVSLERKVHEILNKYSGLELWGLNLYQD